MKPDEAALGLMPIFHAYGLGLMLMALWEDSPFVVMSKFTPEDFYSALITYKVNLKCYIIYFQIINFSKNEKKKKKQSKFIKDMIKIYFLLIKIVC